MAETGHAHNGSDLPGKEDLDLSFDKNQTSDMPRPIDKDTDLEINDDEADKTFDLGLEFAMSETKGSVENKSDIRSCIGSQDYLNCRPSDLLNCDSSENNSSNYKTVTSDRDLEQPIEETNPDFYDSMFADNSQNDDSQIELTSPTQSVSISNGNDELGPLLKISQVFSHAESNSQQENDSLEQSQSSSTHSDTEIPAPVTEHITECEEQSVQFDVEIETAQLIPNSPNYIQSVKPRSPKLSEFEDKQPTTTLSETPVIIDLDRYDKNTQNSAQCNIFDIPSEHSKIQCTSESSDIIGKDESSYISHSLSNEQFHDISGKIISKSSVDLDTCINSRPNEDLKQEKVSEPGTPYNVANHEDHESVSLSSFFTSQDYHNSFGMSCVDSTRLCQTSINQTKPGIVEDDGVSDWNGWYPFHTESVFPYLHERVPYSEKNESFQPNLYNTKDDYTCQYATPLPSHLSGPTFPHEFFADYPRMLPSSYGQVALQNLYGKPVLSQTLGSQVVHPNDRLEEYLWPSHTNGLGYDQRNFPSETCGSNQLLLGSSGLTYDTPSSVVSHMSTETPIVDDEETDDADEFDDMPISFNESDTRFHSKSSTSCYCSDESSQMIDYSPSITPSSSTSGTPGPSLGQETYPVPHETVLFNPWSATGHNDSGYLSPMTRPQCSIEPNMLNFDLPPASFRPYPSMADAMSSSRISKSSIKNRVSPLDDRQFNDPYSRQRKHQIQSDKISTSTGKGPRGRKKVSKPPERKDYVPEGEGSNQASGPRGADHFRSRHNEPLNQQAINIMLQWFQQHLDNPYPTKADKEAMARMGGITENQVKSWFANKRNRTNNTKPKVQKRAMQEKLKSLCLDLERNHHSLTDNTHIIQQLSGIIQHCHVNRQDQ